MKRLLQIALLTVLSACAPSAWAQCATTDYGNGVTCKTFDISGNNSTNQTSVTFTLSTTPSAGDAVIVGAGFCLDSGCGSGTTMSATFTNGAGDTVRTPTTSCRTNNVGSPGFVYRQCIAVFSNVSANTSYTATISGAGGNYPRFYGALMSGLNTSATPFDTDTVSCATTAGGTTMTCNVTLSQTGIVFGIAGNSGSAAFTPGNSFLEIGESCTEGTCGTGNQQQARTNTSGATNSTWTQASDTAIGLAVGIKSAAATATPRLTLIGVGD